MGGPGIAGEVGEVLQGFLVSNLAALANIKKKKYMYPSIKYGTVFSRAKRSGWRMHIKECLL